MDTDKLDPFGDDSEYAAPGDEAQEKVRYSILRGKTGEVDSEAEQGRKLAHHLARIRQAYRLAETRQGALQGLVDEYETVLADLARVKHDLAQVEADRDKECWIDRVLISNWTREATQFTEPAEPRNPTLVFGDMALDVRQKTVREKLTLTDKEAVIRQCPEFVQKEDKLLWGDLKKELTWTPHGIINNQGEIIEGVTWTPSETVDDSAVLLDGKRIPLSSKRDEAEEVEGEAADEAGEPDEQGGQTDEAE